MLNKQHKQRQSKSDEPRVGDLMVPASNVLSIEEPVHVARRWFETGAVRSLIVVDGMRPVGVLGTWELRGADGLDPIWRHMHRQIPLLTVNLTTSSARTLLAAIPANISRLPVVDARGELVGEVARTHLAVQDTSRAVPRGSPIRLEHSDGTVVYRRLAPGHCVLGIDGALLGTVGPLCYVDDKPVAFIVHHGQRNCWQTRVPLALIADLSREAVRLTVDAAAFELVQEISGGSTSSQPDTSRA